MDMSGRAVETKGRLDRGGVVVLKRHPKTGKKRISKEKKKACQ